MGMNGDRRQGQGRTRWKNFQSFCLRARPGSCLLKERKAPIPPFEMRRRRRRNALCSYVHCRFIIFFPFSSGPLKQISSWLLSNWRRPPRFPGPDFSLKSDSQGGWHRHTGHNAWIFPFPQVFYYSMMVVSFFVAPHDNLDFRFKLPKCDMRWGRGSAKSATEELRTLIVPTWHTCAGLPASHWKEKLFKWSHHSVHLGEDPGGALHAQRKSYQLSSKV